MPARFRPTTRSFVLGSLAVTLLMSLVYSTSAQYGHADVPVAKTAAEIQPLGAGDSAPRFTVQTVDSEPFEFDPRNLDQPVVLISFRGGWCPFCNMHLSELRHVLPEISAMGVDVLFLSGDRPELLYASLKQETQQDIEGMDYAILSDAHAQAAIALGIAFKTSDRLIDRLRERGDDIDDSSMRRHGVLPVPAVFAISQQGQITYAHVNPDYKVRVSADELLAAAQGLVAER